MRVDDAGQAVGLHIRAAGLVPTFFEVEAGFAEVEHGVPLQRQLRVVALRGRLRGHRSSAGQPRARASTGRRRASSTSCSPRREKRLVAGLEATTPLSGVEVPASVGVIKQGVLDFDGDFITAAQFSQGHWSLPSQTASITSTRSLTK